MKSKRISAISVGLLPVITGVMLTIFSGCGLSDLRPEEMKKYGITPQAIQKGRALLQKAATAQGFDQWREYKTCRVILTDHWQGLLGRIGKPWHNMEQKIQFDFLINTFTSRAMLLSGQEQGEVWGIQGWRTYKISSDSTPVQWEPDEKVEFYLPTMQYFLEFPFRILSAELIAYAGETTIHNTTYQMVFVTWGSSQPNKQYDQYMLYLNPSTSLIEKVSYTIRDKMDFLIGSIHLSDFRDVQGVKIPFMQTVTSGQAEEAKYPLEQNYLHRFELKSVTFDAVPKQEVIADSGLKILGDRKPVRK